MLAGVAPSQVYCCRVMKKDRRSRESNSTFQWGQTPLFGSAKNGSKKPVIQNCKEISKWALLKPLPNQMVQDSQKGGYDLILDCYDCTKN